MNCSTLVFWCSAVGGCCCRVDGHCGVELLGLTTRFLFFVQASALASAGWQVRLQARYDTRESTYSQDCEFFQCQGEPRPIISDPANGRSQTVMGMTCPTPPAHALAIHHSCLWGHLRPSTGRQPGLHCGAAGGAVGPVEGEAGPTFYQPAHLAANLPRLVEGR